MSSNHLIAKPETLIKFCYNKIEVVETFLSKLLDNPQIRHRKIVIFSIVGAFRKGKSFFLDYCLRFLYAHYASLNYPDKETFNNSNWMGNQDEPLTGFSWRSGFTRDTTGIIIWNDVFLHSIENTGEEIAIIIMDTQGLFDNETSPTDNAKIFAISTMLSSMQVLNLTGVIQEDQLEYLQFATEFSKYAANDNHGTNEKPFQNLVFLIRDWENPQEYPFGIIGGSEYLENILKVTSTQTESSKSIRTHIKNSFDQINCSLLPYPGKIVAAGKKGGVKYNGNYGDMDEDFREELFSLIANILSPINLTLKKSNGNAITCLEFKEYVESYFKLFQSCEMPDVQTIYELHVEKHMNFLINNCIASYKQTLCKNEKFLLNKELIPIFHELGQKTAMLLYAESKKSGGLEYEVHFKKILNEKLDDIFEEWKNHSEDFFENVEEEKQTIRLETDLRYQKEHEDIKNLSKSNQLKIKSEIDTLQKTVNELKFQKDRELVILKRKLEYEEIKLNANFESEKNKLIQDLLMEKKSQENEIAELEREFANEMKKLEEQRKEQIQKRKRELILRFDLGDLTEFGHSSSTQEFVTGNNEAAEFEELFSTTSKSISKLMSLIEN